MAEVKTGSIVNHVTQAGGSPPRCASSAVVTSGGRPLLSAATLSSSGQPQTYNIRVTPSTGAVSQPTAAGNSAGHYSIVVSNPQSLSNTGNSQSVALPRPSPAIAQPYPNNNITTSQFAEPASPQLPRTNIAPAVLAAPAAICANILAMRFDPNANDFNPGFWDCASPIQAVFSTGPFSALAALPGTTAGTTPGTVRCACGQCIPVNIPRSWVGELYSKGIFLPFGEATSDTLTIPSRMPKDSKPRVDGPPETFFLDFLKVMFRPGDKPGTLSCNCGNSKCGLINIPKSAIQETFGKISVITDKPQADKIIFKADQIKQPPEPWRCASWQAWQNHLAELGLNKSLYRSSNVEILPIPAEVVPARTDSLSHKSPFPNPKTLPIVYITKAANSPYPLEVSASADLDKKFADILKELADPNYQRNRGIPGHWTRLNSLLGALSKAEIAALLRQHPELAEKLIELGSYLSQTLQRNIIEVINAQREALFALAVALAKQHYDPSSLEQIRTYLREHPFVAQDIEQFAKMLRAAYDKGRFDIALFTGRSGFLLLAALMEAKIPFAELPPVRSQPSSGLITIEHRAAIPLPPEDLQRLIAGWRAILVDDVVGSQRTIIYARTQTNNFVGAAMYMPPRNIPREFLKPDERDILYGNFGTGSQ